MDPYNVLKVNKNSTMEEIKKSYRTLSKIYHPDRPNGDTEQFKIISHAYELLVEINNQKNLPNNIPNTQDFNNNIYPIPVLDINCTINADLSDIYNGTIKKFKVNRYQYSHIAHPILEEKYLEVKIPAGFPSGQNLIILNEGNRFIDENNQILKGNILIQIIETNNSAFKHDGVNLIYPVTISLRRALCGFQLNIIHLDGRKLTISIDNVVFPGMNYVIPNEGMPQTDHMQGDQIRNLHFGDMIIIFDIEFPKELNKLQKDSLNKIL